ncbi:VOC family protein [Paraburkholderia sp. 2C]
MSTNVWGQRSAVHSIDHFALNVPSLDDARHFFNASGLYVRDVDDGTDLHLELRALDGHRWARILPAASKSLAYLSFSCFETHLGTLVRQVRDAGGRICRDGTAVAEGRRHTTMGFWFNDPDGNLVHVGVGHKTSPNEKIPSGRYETRADTRGVRPGSQEDIVRPRRMSHVMLFTTDLQRAIDFYQSALGLCLSDRSADVIAFMSGVHGSDHHMIALARSTAKGWHHSAWDVDGIDQVGLGSVQMASAGYKRGWGTGRHCLGSNYFHYVMDPWGSFFEFSSDIDHISAGKAWTAGDFSPEESLTFWSPDIPPYFIHNTEA